jgi:hypothetical protein
LHILFFCLYILQHVQHPLKYPMRSYLILQLRNFLHHNLLHYYQILGFQSNIRSYLTHQVTRSTILDTRLLGKHSHSWYIPPP